MIRDAARSVVAAAVTCAAIGYLMLRAARRDLRARIAMPMATARRRKPC